MSLANYYLWDGELSVGDFVMFNAYNLQIYMPLGFLGYIWREIQSNLVHVEEVLNLLNLDELIPEKQKPDECRIKAG